MGYLNGLRGRLFQLLILMIFLAFHACIFIVGFINYLLFSRYYYWKMKIEKREEKKLKFLNIYSDIYRGGKWA